MTARRDLDRLMTAWLDADAPVRAPSGLADRAIAGVARTERRPAWRIPERWLSVQATARLAYYRPAFAGAALVILAILALVAVAIIGAPRHRLGSNGLLAFDSNGQIVVANADGSNRRPLTSTANGDSNPIFSPDGQLIAFWRQESRSLPATLVVIDLGGGPDRILATGVGMQGGSVSWSPDNRHLAYADEQEDLDSSTGDVLLGNAQGFVVALDGTRTPIGDPGALVLDPTFSPDGETIAYRSGTGDTVGIYASDADGTHPRRVTTAAGSGFAFWRPRWSPDSRSIVFVAGDNRSHDVYVVNADGTGERPVTTKPGAYWWPVWSPGGARVAYVDEGLGQVVIVPASGGPQVAVGSTVRNFPFSWSPDGTELYALSQDSDKLLVIDATGARGQIEVEAAGNNTNIGSWQRLAP